VVSFCLDKYKQSEERIMPEDIGVDCSRPFTYHDDDLPVMVVGSFILEISDRIYGRAVGP
jgi:hypothetical protein